MHIFASNFLTFLERREEKLLSWGFHNIQYSQSEMLDFLLKDAPQDLIDQWKSLEDGGLTFRTFIRELRQSNLIYQMPENPNMYRTRMAEGVRLLANLRQLFCAEDWAIGPRLVSDIKIHLNARVYPKRDIPSSEIWNNDLKKICNHRSEYLLGELYKALSSDSSGNGYLFSGFQRRSFKNIFKEYESKKWTGSVICAGTGSGKTKAFYLPAFLKVAEEISRNSSEFTKVIAIYPRNVLLADQLREALSENEKLRPILKTHGHRSITFGALLGSAPRKSWFKNPIKQDWHWERRDGGHVIPYLKSLIDGQSDLVWKQQDIDNDCTALYRPGASQPDVPDKVLRINREHLMKNPPDVLFLSLEMLNREMGNPQWQKAFGIRQRKNAPRLLLLDEVHTHEGISGAQAAWVLRRWKYWMRSGQKGNPPHFVGLSATLRDAPEHLAKICGILPANVSEFSPNSGVGDGGEMKSEGQEYNLAIKGDPSSGSALLSTSIQTAMLLTRILTNRNYTLPRSIPIHPNELFLKKAFGFTDNLDSLNRWFANMQNAEMQRLAKYREVPNPMPDTAIMMRMRDEGQIWELPIKIGHNLNQRLEISRCSSTDPGLDVSSDLIIATSSLEVGFDDPQVGMIFHHKAPVSMSSFIQRRGRAGRQRGSRPWTVVVLSDYGRDRWAFQSVERLFKPEVDKIYLPIMNPYVLRVQMTLFLVDWLGQNIGIHSSPFLYLSKPENWQLSQKAQEEAKRILKDFLEQGKLWDRFFDSALIFYLYGRGGLLYQSEKDKEVVRCELHDIFWEEPRPLLTNAIPSLLRKLETNWHQMGPQKKPEEDKNAGRPFPSFIPKATFEELGLTEARIELEDYEGINKKDETLSMSQFFRESCPGRVSKRFSNIFLNNRPEPGFWNDYSTNLIPGQNIATVKEIFPENYSLTLVGKAKIYSPTATKLNHITTDIVESSMSDWQWQTLATIHHKGNKDTLMIKGSKPWNHVFSETTAHLHINGSWVKMLRYSSSCKFEIRRRKADSFQGTLNLQSENNAPEAVGFQLNADGLKFVLNNDHLEDLPLINTDIKAQFRYEYFLHKLKKSTILEQYLNVFQIEWMAQISMAMITATAIRKNVSLCDAQKRLKDIRLVSAQRVLESIFQLSGITEEGQREESRLQQDLLLLWENPVVVSEIECLEPVLWEISLGHDFDQWILERYVATLSQALRVAAATISDQIAEEDLTVDVISIDGQYEILITEKNSGGLGQIESVVNEIKRDPRYFLDAFENAIGYCPRKSWAVNLKAVSKIVCKEYGDGHGQLSEAFQEVRDAKNLVAIEKAKNNLIIAMFDRGLNPQRNNVSAVSMKLLRPGSAKETDYLTYILNAFWKRYNKRFGIEIPIRTFAYVACSFPQSQKRLIRMFRSLSNETPTTSQLFSIVQQLLFQGCEDSCPDCLNSPNYFNDFGKPARNLALAWLSLGVSEFVLTPEVERDAFLEKIRKVLVKHGAACLVSETKFKENLLKITIPLFFEEINVKTYRDSVHINKIEQSGGLIKIYLKIRDFTNV